MSTPSETDTTPDAAPHPDATEETDPLAGIPEAVRERVGAFDTDTAGGCG
ncbi:hypothetical protein [Salinactinospora qingdaonensis]|uniref:Uncharacterized protein n=1 Tax=Salinactinospora qingdaonensis TaxID=702744 RepID=A0ABP7FCE9_9ACTN